MSARKAHQREVSNFRWILPAALLLVTLPAAARAVSEPPPLRPKGMAIEHAEANLVLVDVLVRDRDGKSVAGLKQGDFDLLIDRLPAPIASFEDACVETPAATPGAEATASGPPAPPAPAEKRHIVMFFDIAQLTRVGRNRSLDAALKFVRDSMRPEDSVMLLAMKGKPILLESFTSDRDRLAARLEAVKADDDMLDMSVVEERLNMLDIMSKDCAPLDPECHARLSVASAYALAEEAKTRRSLSALKSLMPALAAIRGRKSLVYFSETLRDEPGLQYLLVVGSSPAQIGINLKPVIQDLHKEANISGVSFYPVFAAGLGEGSGSSFNDASMGRIASGDTQLPARAGQAGEDAALGLETTLALETGGQSLKRSNDLSRTFAAMSADLSCYYVIGYANTGPGDGKRHSIIVKAKTKGYDVRHRPYFEDLSEITRLDKKFTSALIAPAYYREIATNVNAFQLAPSAQGIPFLVKIDVPLDAVTLVNQADGKRAGEVEVRGKVWSGPNEACKFSRRFPVGLEPGETTASRHLVYEAGCVLQPGSYDLTVAVLDGASWEIGGAETPLPVKAKAPGVVGDVLLWTSTIGDYLVAADAVSVGIQDSGSGHGFVPKSERRFDAREAALIYAIVCPPPAAGSTDPAAGRLDVSRSIISGDSVVAAFPPLQMGSPAQPAKDCEGSFATIPPGRLQPGLYTFQVKVTGAGGDPILRRANFAVDAGAKN
ncbi:MAG: VWA domain-containing protein [Acidobacteria bacterium]|nr:VWA domain-containing protein [Acidobacteriota bacterium]